MSENDQTVGRLWLGLLWYYGVTYNVIDHVISIRQEKILLRGEKKWKTKRMAIEGILCTHINAINMFANTYMSQDLTEGTFWHFYRERKT